MKDLTKYLLIFAKGLVMGAADVIPGVSGGTIALLTGIYQRLLDAISSINAQALKLLFKGEFKALWKHLDATFLLSLLSGIAFSIIILAKVITELLHDFPIQVWSFFFGLVIISAILVAKKVSKLSLSTSLLFLVGIVIAYLITSLSPSHTSEAYPFLFLSGAIAICAMILPGISGSFILLILGKYEFVLGSLKEFNLPVIIVFAAGCVTGLLSFSRVISWFLKHYYDLTMALLAGFMFGSLNKIWPWKEIIATRLNSKGEQVPFIENNISPDRYIELYGGDSHILEAILLAVSAIVLIYGIEFFASKLEKNTNE